ncbi:hypothetical protein ABW20_dc0102007 [Dactylellina cionopaga]|nr:hypothetical protein ABW20_dc0102007 [Dactylellina cionopaga]
MFTCPTRRALLSCASHAPPTTSRRLISTGTANSLRPQPQRPTRRYSSSSSSSNSKPFGPNNRGLASKTGAFRKRDRQCENGQTAQTVAPPIPNQEVEVASAEKPTVVEESPKVEPQQQRNSPLPFVARTDHLRAKDIHASAFFALHRPVSVRFPVPGIYSNASFQKLFDEPSPLSNMEIHKIQQEVQARQPTLREAESPSNEQGSDEVRGFARNASLSLDQKSPVTELQIKIPTPAQFGEYVPFRPPPPPEPISESEMKLEPIDPQKIKGIRILSSSDPSGQGQPGYIFTFFPAEEPSKPQNGRLRVYMRSVPQSMYALSVKRQRKLKMKKHKYKKLMKRTRTLRRKLEKQ